MRGERGVTLVELVVALGLLLSAAAAGAPALSETLETLRAHGAARDLYAAVHLTKARARATGVMHALVLESDGSGFSIVADPAGAARIVDGPHRLGEGVVASANATIRFSPKGFAVPFGTITVRAGAEVRRVVVNILGRVRVAAG